MLAHLVYAFLKYITEWKYKQTVIYVDKFFVI